MIVVIGPGLRRISPRLHIIGRRLRLIGWRRHLAAACLRLGHGLLLYAGI